MGLEVIQKIKKEKGLTTEMISKLSGVPVGTLNKILNGETKDPKLETLKAIARVLGCTLDDFDDVTTTMNSLLYDEEELVEIYRDLTKENKEKVLQIASALLTTQKGDEIIRLANESKESTETA